MDTEKKQPLRKLIIQFVKFGFVGASNTVISMAIYYLLVFLGVHYIIANLIGFVAGTFNAYYWNSRVVFKGKGDRKEAGKSLFRTFASYGATFLLSTVLLYFWVDIVGISDKIAQIPNICITMPLNFILSKFWAFRANKE